MRESGRLVMKASFLLVLCLLMILTQLSRPSALMAAAISSGACPKPATPSVVFPPNGRTGISTSLTLSWTESSNADSYDVYFGTSSNPSFLGSTAGTTYPKSGLAYSTTYYWKVVAKNSCGSSASGSLWRFTTGPCPKPEVPSKPSPSTSATEVSINSVLSWTAASSDSYDVYLGTTSYPPLVATTTNSSYSPSSLSYGRTYYWRIVAKNGFGKSTTGPLWYFRTTRLDTTVPSVPTGVTATAASCGQINLSWSASSDSGGSGLKGYNLYRNGSYLKQVLAPSTSTSDTGLAASTVYSYTVSAIDNAGNESPRSSTASTNTPACSDLTPPSAAAAPPAILAAPADATAPGTGAAPESPRR